MSAIQNPNEAVRQQASAMLGQHRRLYQQVSDATRHLAAVVYRDPDTAKAYAGSPQGGAIFGAIRAGEAFLNATGPAAGVTEPVALTPPGYTVTPNADGTAALTYVDPTAKPAPAPASVGTAQQTAGNTKPTAQPAAPAAKPPESPKPPPQQQAAAVPTGAAAPTQQAAKV